MTDEDIRAASEFREFIPIDPLPPGKVTYVVNDAGGEKTLPWESIDQKVIRSLLHTQASTMTTYRLDASGEAEYLTTNMTGQVGEYRLVMDYAKYRPDRLTNDSGRQIGQARVGVGLRIKASIRTTRANVDLGSLFALGLAAKRGVVQGKLEVYTIGIESSEITAIFPTPSTIDETSIQRAMEAIAVIKSKISADGTHLTPQIVAIRVDQASALREPVRSAPLAERIE